MTHAQILDEPPVTVPRRLLRTILVVGIAFAGIVGVGCTPYPTEPFPPNPDPLTDVQYWNAGDSVAWMWPQYSTHTIHNAARGGNGFLVPNAGTIETYTLARLGDNRPQWMFVLGGVVDWYRPLEDVIAAMQHFEDTMAGLGIKTVWVTEAGRTDGTIAEVARAMQPMMAWMLTRPYHIDCVPDVLPYVPPTDVHPSTEGYRAYAACVDAHWPT